MKSSAVSDIIAAVLLLVFGYAAISQLFFHHTFYEQLRHGLENPAAAAIVSWAMPCVQLIVCILLWRRATRLKALVTALALLSVYTVYLVRMLPREGKSLCACGELAPWLTLEINILLHTALIFLTSTAIVLAAQLNQPYKGV
jgi:hypothetical protein